MIRDADGHKIEKGNNLHVSVGNSWMKVEVIEATEGGTLITNEKQMGMTPDKLTLQFELQCIDAPPGKNHPALLRLVNPKKEVIVPVATRDVS